MRTWRDDCPHVVECSTQYDCDALTAASTSKPLSSESEMSTKQKTEADTENLALARAQRIEALATAAVQLRSLGAFPAVEGNVSQLLSEITVLTREMHEARVARAGAHK